MRLPQQEFALSLVLTAACGDNRLTAADTTTPDQVGDLAEIAPADSAVPSDGDSLDDSAGPDLADLADSTPEVEVTPTCAQRPVAFPLPTSVAPWNHLSSDEISRLGGANHRGQDVIVQVGHPQVLVAKFAYAFLDVDMLCEDVDVWVQREVPCGAWEWLGKPRTTDAPDDSLDCNNYGRQYGIEDDGGRVFLAIPETQALPVGRHPVRMVLRGDLTLASFDLIVIEPGTQAIITDIDGTLTTGDDQLITEVALNIFNETYDQQMYPDADQMIRTYYDKGYLIIYASGRPDMLRRMTEHWVEPRFAPGPIHHTDTNAQVVPNIDGVGIYKRDYINLLKAEGVIFVAAYGNATTDVWAYAQTGLPLAQTWIIGPHAGEEGTMGLTSYTDHLATARAFPEATTKAPPAFGWW